MLLTQVARALGLQERYDEAHALLDDLAVSDDEVVVRVSLERGRLLRSAGDPDAARPHFDAAERTAAQAGLDALRVDAIHMQALVAAPEDQLALNDRALEIASHSRDQAARDWDASLLNNIGMVHADAGDFADALSVFEQALAARERIGDPDRIRVARWMVAWALRNLGRTDRRARDAARDQGRARRGRSHRPARRRRAGAPRGLTTDRKFCGSGRPRPDVYGRVNRSRPAAVRFRAGGDPPVGSR